MPAACESFIAQVAHLSSFATHTRNAVLLSAADNAPHGATAIPDRRRTSAIFKSTDRILQHFSGN